VTDTTDKDTNERTNERTDGRTDGRTERLFVRPSIRLLDGVWLFPTISCSRFAHAPLTRCALVKARWWHMCS